MGLTHQTNRLEWGWGWRWGGRLTRVVGRVGEAVADGMEDAIQYIRSPYARCDQCPIILYKNGCHRENNDNLRFHLLCSLHYLLPHSLRIRQLWAVKFHFHLKTDSFSLCPFYLPIYKIKSNNSREHTKEASKYVTDEGLWQRHSWSGYENQWQLVVFDTGYKD